MSDIVRGTVKRTNVTRGCQEVQLDLLADETTDPDVEHYEQAGVSFRLSDDAETLVLALGGAQQNRTSLLTSGRGKRPTTAIQAGEGGLYYAGEFKVFLKSDGSVYLGSKDATDYVALASKVVTELNAIRTMVATHVHSVTVTGTATTQSGTTLAAGGAGSAGSVAATKVKAI